MIHLHAASSQAVSSFGEGSECVYIQVSVCVCVSHSNTFVLSRWYIFRQCLIKMFHLLAREVNLCTYNCLCVYVCATVKLLCCQNDTSLGSLSSRYSIFWQVKWMCVHVSLSVFLCVCVCHCNTSVLSRWYIFRQFINRFNTRDEAIQHVSDEHQISTQIMHLNFSSFDAFLVWKQRKRGRHILMYSSQMLLTLFPSPFPSF